MNTQMIRLIGQMVILLLLIAYIVITSAAQAGERDCLKNTKGAVIGCTTDFGGYIVLKDSRGKTIGRYNKQSNRTVTPTGKSIGSGNQLLLLIPPER